MARVEWRGVRLYRYLAKPTICSAAERNPRNEWHRAEEVFNTSGKKYRELELKEKLPEMTADEQYELLASDGMLIKRPLAWDGSQATLGFKEDTYANTWS